ncbi:MAG: hypothetical protein VW518_00425 [Burkholderiaceae bacterium]
MSKIIAVSFNIAEQEVMLHTAEEWKEKIAEARDLAIDGFESGWNCTDPAEAVDCMDLDTVFEYAFGDEFWYEVFEEPKYGIYAVAFDLQTETFITCYDDQLVEAICDSGRDDEIFWND